MARLYINGFLTKRVEIVGNMTDKNVLGVILYDINRGEKIKINIRIVSIIILIFIDFSKSQRLNQVLLPFC